MLNSVFAVVLAAGIAAGVAFREAVVALLYDPPVVMCAGDWCSGCRRVPGGVEITAESAPDVVFSFEGLAAEVPLGYVVSEVASGAELFSGEGALVPLSLVSDTAVKVRFYALSGEVDWSEVSAVSAVQSEPLAASPAGLRSGKIVSNASREGTRGVVMEESEGFKRAVSGGSFSASLANDVDGGFEFCGVMVAPGASVVGSVEQFPVAFEMTFPNGHGALNLAAGGYVCLDGEYTLQAGADDNVSVSIGEASVSLRGESAFRTGNV